MNKIIKAQLEKVHEADLSNFDKDTCTYVIPRKRTIKLELEQSYLIRLKPQAFNNDAVIINWNAGKKPISNYMRVEVVNQLPGMVRVVGICQDSAYTSATESTFWSGWLSTCDIDVLQKL